MNPIKKDNGWILCPSKSFPGKFYYFNVVNGDTAWSLNEAERKYLRIPELQKIDKGSTYPEPSSPPVDNPPPKFKSPTPPPTTFNQPNVQPKVQQKLQPRYPSTIQHNVYTNGNVSNVSKFTQIPVPTFGQVTFPKPLPPIQIQVPVISPYRNQTAPQVLMIMMNQFDPSHSIGEPEIDQLPQMEADRELLVQTCNIPLCERFINYKNPVINFNNSNKIEKPPEFHSSTPKKLDVPMFPNDQSSIDSFGLSKMNLIGTAKHSKSLIRKPIFNLTQKHNKNPHNATPKKFTPDNNGNQSMNPKSPMSKYNNSLTKPIFSKDFFPVKENLSKQNIFLMSTEKEPHKVYSTLKQTIKVDISDKSNAKSQLKKSTEDNFKIFHQSKMFKEKSTLLQEDKADNKDPSNKNVDLKHLDKNDLRILLMAKKRKSIDSRKTETLTGKTIKTVKPQISEPVTPKKKVTFNLLPENCSDIVNSEEFFNCDAGNSPSKTADNTALLESKLAPYGTDWCLVCDTNVLLEEFELIDNFVELDSKCHLLIPCRVMSDIVALSRSECLDRSRVKLARHLLRRLETPLPRVIVQTSIDDSTAHISTAESILKCCLKQIEENGHVILITNERNLQTKAGFLKIPCFTSQLIKDGAIRQPEVRFDIKRIKISVPNLTEKGNLLQDEVPTHTFKKKLFEITQNFDQNSTNNSLESQLDANESDNAGKPEWKHSAKGIDKDLENINLTEKPKRFQIQKDVTSGQVQKLPTTPRKEKNTNETVSFYFQNKSKEPNQSKLENKRGSEKEPQTVSFYFQNEIQNQNFQSNSKFNLANDRRNVPKTKSLFEIDNDKQSQKVQPNNFLSEIDGIEKLTKRQSIFNDKCKSNPSIFENLKNAKVQLQNSLFENCQFPNRNTSKDSSIFKIEKYENRDQMNSSIFEIEKYKNKEVHQASIFYIDEDDNQPVLPANGMINHNVAIEEYLNKFYEKNKNFEDIIEEREEQLICNFVQVMEDCLSNVLQQSSSLLEDSSPPWTLAEALQCIIQLYGSHTTVDTLCNLLYEAIDAQKKEARDVIRCFGCGLLLIRYLKSVLHPAADTENLLDAEDDLNNILQNIGHEEVEVQPKTPVLCVTDVHYEDDHKRRNFVKDRSEMIKYLKNHFPAWANYDDTLANATSNPVWGRNCKDIKIVRTFGKDLGLLKISNSKQMTMNQTTKETKQDTVEETKNHNEQKVITKEHTIIINDKNNNTSVKTDKESEKKNKLSAIPNSPKNMKDKFKELKLIRKVRNNQTLAPKDNSVQKHTNFESSSKPDKKSRPRSETVKVFSSMNATKTDAGKVNGLEVQKATTVDQTNSKFERKAEPKVVRPFSKINKRENVNTDNEKPNFDLKYTTHGHTFGTSETGPKVVRSIQMIPAFEEKLKFRQPLDLEELDYSPLSEDDQSIGNTEYDCLSIIVDDTDDTGKNYVSTVKNAQGDVKKYFADVTNDKKNYESTVKNSQGDLKNYFADATNDNKAPKYNMQNDTNFTNCDSYSMSFDNCAANVRKDANYATNETVKKEHGDNYDESYVTYNSSTNDNYFSSEDYETKDEVYARNKSNVNYISFVNDYETNDHSNSKDDTPRDSGIDSDSMNTYSFVKSFLCEVRQTLKLVHKFLDGSLNEMRDTSLLDSNKQFLHSRTNSIREQIKEIIASLEGIIQRESTPGTSIKILISASVLPSGKQRIMSYKDVVTKYLEQARTLEAALKIMLTVTECPKTD